MSIPSMVLKPVKPLLPPTPVSLRKKSNAAAKVMARVIIEKYKPLIIERNSKNPKIQAMTPATKTTSSIHQTKYSVQTQKHSTFIDLRKLIKTGMPPPADWRIKYMSKA